MELVDVAETEVRAFYAFVGDWFRGERPRTNDELSRLETALGVGFHRVDPAGSVDGREAFLDGIDSQHASERDAESAFRVEIESIEGRFGTADVCLLTYHDHRRTAGDWRTRVASALFERAEDSPSGVVWRHLHETWMTG